MCFHTFSKSYLCHQKFNGFLSIIHLAKSILTLLSCILGIQKLVLSGRISEAIEATHSLYPGLLDRNLGLLFKLKCRQFIEMVSGCDSEVKPSAHSPTRSAKSSPCASPSRTLSHTSIVSNVSSSNSTTNGFDNGELGPPRSIDMAQELVGNGVSVDEDSEMDDMTDANQSTSNNNQSASTYQSASNSSQYFNNSARGKTGVHR